MGGFSRFCRSFGCALALAGTVTVLASCDLTRNQLTYDRSAELDRQHFRDGLSPAPQPPDAAVAPVPDFQPVLSTPQELRLPTPLVTVSVNQTVSLRDLLFELAEQAEVDLELDPQIHGSIIFTAKERPFDEVVDRICEMAGLRYRFENDVLRVELDRPYLQTYSINYLNVTRGGESSMETSISLSTGGGGGAGGGSTSSVETSFEPDVWADLEANIEQILTSSDTYVSLATLSDPMASPVNPAPPPMPVSQDPGAPPPAPLPGADAVSAMPPAVAPMLNVTPASDPLIPNPPATYSISRQSGTLTVFASQRQHRQVQEYLKAFHKLLTTQVLIEAKVLEVALTDEYSTGIDWNTFNLTGLTRMTIDLPQPALTPAVSAGTLVSGIVESGNDFKFTMDAISRFGSVRALSSPRVTVLNNQPAVVNVAKSIVYITFDVTPPTTTDGTTSPPTISANINSVPEGVLLNVLPKANPDTGEVYLSVRPTISKITDFVTDPTTTLQFALNSVAPPAGLADNRIPQVSVQEMDSLVRLQSGQIMVMGGLMKDSNTVTQTGVPVVGDIPFLGNLFRSHVDSVQKSELVILLRATVVPGSNLDEMDRRLYRTFGMDRRPAPL